VGHEELIRHLIRSAEEKRDGILARAREETGRIAEEALRKSEVMEREARDAAGREAERERLVRMSRARMDARAVRLRARDSLANAVLTRLEERLSRLAVESRYPLVAERLYREILPEIPEGNVVLCADERAREVLEPMAAGPRFRFEPLREEEIAGVEVSDESGAFLLRNTLGSRFVKARPELMAEVSRRRPFPDE
jgi:vacuolar-type H+-ATPase subunit E/Vma4